ncbi:MAG: EVE domain-containing protein [Thiobacillaceae bacterium]|nr:EVE domain-containing protein [Thiobacillaceae bacterium]MDW8323686.1 EVE domain-containing protein [Burkholderiales bacterium]
MRYWLMKSEPSEYSIDDLVRDGVSPWFGVRNYQARNYMRNEMAIGDGVLFYHSSCAQPGIAGIAEVASRAYADATQFDPNSKYYDPKATPERPRWFHVDVRICRKTRLMSLAEMRSYPELADMRVLARGNRLSITPVTPQQWRFILDRLDRPA